jgi:hypothetical protein
MAKALSPLCSLWPFSASSVLSSETLNTEVTKFHREPQSSKAKTKNLRRANISTLSCTNMSLYAFGIREWTAPVAPVAPVHLLLGENGQLRHVEIR